jgi:antitoxin (DNA-binding transcriptional repressor) of toxin-antitoxin stability system
MNKKAKYIPAGKFKAQCLQIMDDIQSSKTPIIVTKHGKPVVTIAAYEEDKTFPIGSFKSTVLIHGDIVKPTGEVWDAESGK